jgi:cytoskeletal protein CcmA (bactofilin family)
MWKFQKDEEKPFVPATPKPATSPVTPLKEPRPVEMPRDSFRPDVAHIGKSVIVKGELSGSEDLYLDGEVEGSIELRGHNLIIGPNGRVRANIHARDVIVQGKLDGNIQASERVELKKSAIVIGDVFTQRIVIEDGAYFKGGIDIQREPAKRPNEPPAPKEAVKAEAKPVAVPVVSATAAGAPLQQTSLLEPKK